MRVLALDVTLPESIAAAIEVAGPIDVLVNHAGIGVVGVFEATPMSTVREVFETDFAKPILASFAQVTTVTTESDVADAVYQRDQMRWPWLRRPFARAPKSGPVLTRTL